MTQFAPNLVPGNLAGDQNPDVGDGDDEGPSDGMVSIREAKPELTYYFQNEITGTLYMASDQMEKSGNYVDFTGTGADEERTLENDSTATFARWLDSGDYHVAVTADGYHTAFANVSIPSEVKDEENPSIDVFNFYDGESELEEKGGIAEEEVMITSGDERVATTQYANFADGDGVDASYGVENGTVYLGTLDFDTSEEVDVTVTVDGVTEVEETVDSDEEFELGNATDPLVAEDSVGIVVDGYSSMNQTIALNDIYGTEHISLTISDA